MNKESKLNLNASNYAISHFDSNKTYNCLEVHKMLCDAYIAGNNDTLDDNYEEIRKALINIFATHKDYEMFFGVSVKDIRAWIEKQVSPDMIADAYLRGCNDTEKKWLEEQNVIKDCNSIDPHFGKPITTTETKYPKFKVGDWISGYYTNYKVLSINNEGYAVEDVDGNKINILFENEKFHHLWSIKDAKDGDVLVCCNNKPFIFKGFFGLNFPNCLAAYCGVTLENQFRHCNGKTFWTNQDVKPATKEQCNLLFQKMHEAGYEWDAEKKVLNKIKMQDLVISENNVTKISDQDDKWKWDEDDEKFFRENILIGLGNIDDVNPELYSKIIDWISLIKRRLS